MSPEKKLRVPSVSRVASLFLLLLGLTVVSAQAQLTAGGNELWTQTSPGIWLTVRAGSRFGEAVEAGDFDGDGLDDLVVGVPRLVLENGVGAAGGVVVIFGRRPALDACCGVTMYIDQDSTEMVDEAEGIDHFGFALAVGDFNGDGYGDLAVGVPGEDISGVTNAGAVHVLYGPDLTENELWTLGLLGRPMAEGDSFGEVLESGDFNGDNYADLVVGIWEKNVGGFNRAGAVEVIYGSDSGLRPQGNQFWTMADVSVGGPEVYSDLGRSLATGDFDRDGYEDLALSGSETLESLGRIEHVYILYGLAVGLAPSGSQSWNEGNLGVAGRTAEEFTGFGRGLSAGDFDGDDFADLAIGAFGTDISDNGSLAAGAVYVLHGNQFGLTASRTQFWNQNSPGMEGAAAEGDAFGAGLATGDFDGNGFSDVVIGIPGKDVDEKSEAGAVLVVYGSVAGLTSDGNQLWHQGVPGILDSPETSDFFGGFYNERLAAGNFNGDGGTDLVVAVPLEDQLILDDGAVHVLYSSIALFIDGFESGDTSFWSGSEP